MCNVVTERFLQMSSPENLYREAATVYFGDLILKITPLCFDKND